MTEVGPALWVSFVDDLGRGLFLAVCWDVLEEPNQGAGLLAKCWVGNVGGG
jgi:hypothetical protein